MDIRISGIIKESVVDGPGIRYVIFAQGCLHKCIGCHNPHTHDFKGGYDIDVDDLKNDIIRNPFIDGVTFSGGDPFYQVEGFYYLAKELKKNNIHIVCYTGFFYEDIVKNNDKKKLLENVDLLIDGPFILSQKTLKLPFRGSSNQRIIDVKRSLMEGEVITVEY
ncbi:anaerobic ribonucleoside-triphosphate reductase activating protein [Caloramator sp. E03]|uniref:anaerobic ribonucleoside-triphosphate reductase activating protein n=1 Tax=Caloramator sp. E03 TaxID=2576307 RepID=UPI001110D690|nr:anaerobic ribonucleoside-triphosphate reductase activating protein [Caloramator sp. E03]QCX32568.1 anaerobic ribonucleoside-triphosphate reductase activating protein [Caloramator sp. E03]